MPWAGWRGVLDTLVFPERAMGEESIALYAVPYMQVIFLLELLASSALRKQVYNLRQSINNLAAPVIVFFTMRERWPGHSCRRCQQRTPARMPTPDGRGIHVCLPACLPACHCASAIPARWLWRLHLAWGGGGAHGWRRPLAPPPSQAPS